ncbi:CMP-sialic acid transporter [Rhincodon typus]|uniref:CMP-sialic acid transporter n=1 Tax=Rhincodon typus TaxID=259920 RepID=UPI00202DE9FB|nr:CMP-sialic acid transporter [Rhincodon typus]
MILFVHFCFPYKSNQLCNSDLIHKIVLCYSCTIRRSVFTACLLILQVEQNPVLGFVAIAIAVLCSGFAGVYFEKVLKSSETSLWVRNIQMYISGIAVTAFGVYVTDGAQVMEKGFFFGYTHWVWFVVLLASLGGLYTSVVVKYTDNIMKGFSAAAAIVISTVASMLLFGLQITPTFVSGAILVCISIYYYGLPKQNTMTIQQTVTEKSKQPLEDV